MSDALPCNVLGVDLSSRAIDLVLLDENANRASWTRIDLEGPTAFERARDVAKKMPQPGWYEAHGVYLVAVERPFSQSRADSIRLVQGCVIAEIPRRLDLLEVAPQTWKAHIGFKGKGKPGMLAFPRLDLEVSAPEGLRIGGSLPQDALDALGCALWARDTNAQLISDALSAA